MIKSLRSSVVIVVLVLLLNDVEVAANGLEAARSIGWRGRELLNAQAPGGGQMAPVALPKHERTHYPLVAALLILMAVAVAAICCCCWQWEGHMRLHARRLRGHHHSHHNSHSTSAPSSSTSSSQEFPGAPPRVSSQVSVLMPGDNIPRFIAWSVPQGSPPAAIPADEARKPPQQVSEPDLKVADI